MEQVKSLHNFICGMSRGGTTWLGYCLNEHPDIAVFGESLFWGRYYVNPSSGGRYSTDDIERIIKFQKSSSRAYFGNDIGCLKHIDRDRWAEIVLSLRGKKCTPGELYQILAERVSQLELKSVVVEKTPHHVNHVARISEFFPDSRFIVMVRNPYSFMLSYKNQGLQKSREQQLSLSKYFHPIGCALIWKAYARQALIVSGSLSNRVLLIRFEDMLVDPQDIWRRVLTFLGVTSCELPVIEDRNSSFTKHDRPTLSKSDVFWMNLISGQLIRELGYGREPAGYPLKSIIASLFQLLPWALYLCRDISGRTSSGIIRYAFHWFKKGLNRG
ncbi:sulfotransferase family protein [Coraliomargarita parva]|uniref:sulfotransferase family protein n=1 Tax=Coraliomargarita parva TaxID=3014050 RepID=UPI0022B55044|nr:sulfotransferase [Coraliomargarita parva]